MRYRLGTIAFGLLLSIYVCSAFGAPSKYRWRKPQITLSVSTSVISNSSNIAAGSDVLGAVDRSIATWQQAAAVSLRRVLSNEQNVSANGGQGDGVSLLTIAGSQENTALFPRGLDDATARTRIFYDGQGFITEADIVLNPFVQFSTDGTPGTYDLESTLTHEIGHLLGLSHSPVIGATMSDGYGKNGVYSLSAFSARTLAADDIASLRSVYGVADDSDECCGRISGKLNLALNRVRGLEVWAEDAESGRVLAAAPVSVDGSFKIGGLTPGKLHLYLQSDADIHSSASDLGEFNVTTKQPAVVMKHIDRISTNIRFDYLGFNGQFAGMAVPVNSGSSYFLLAGTTEVSSYGVTVESTSDLISVQSRPITGSYSKDIKTFGFEAAISPDALPGEYSIALRSPTGDRRFLIGALTVEKFPNFWSIAASK